MYLSEIKRILPSYVARIDSDKGSGPYEVIKRVGAVTEDNEFFIHHVFDLLALTRSFGMHAQLFILDHKTQITLPDETFVLSTELPNPSSKTGSTPNVIIADSVGRGLYLLTSWIGSGGDWAAAPGIAVLSVHKKLSACTLEEQELVSKVIGKDLSAKIFEKEGLYGVIPLSSSLDDLDWVDSGADFFLRFILVRQMPTVKTVSVEGHLYKQLAFGTEIVGAKTYPIPADAYEALHNSPDYAKSMEMDIFPNLIGFADQAAEEFGRTDEEGEE
jgi:hypothetical protein